MGNWRRNSGKKKKDPCVRVGEKRGGTPFLSRTHGAGALKEKEQSMYSLGVVANQDPQRMPSFLEKKGRPQYGLEKVGQGGWVT